MNKVRTQLLWVWASRVKSELQSGCLTIYSEGRRSKTSAAVFMHVTGLIKVQPKALFLTQDWHKTVSTTWLSVALWSIHWHSHTQQCIVWAPGCCLFLMLWSLKSANFSFLSVHCLVSAGHDVEDLIPQLKVRILELLLKMQPKLKVQPPYCVYDIASMIRLIMSICIWFCITLGLELNPINWTQNPRSNQGCSHSSLYTKMLLCNWHAFITYFIYSSLSCKEHDMLLTHSHNMLQTHTDSQMNKAACRGKADL